MKTESKKSNPIMGNIVIPGDKSISHRSLIFGAISEGITEVKDILTGEDVIATMNALRSMGVRIYVDNGKHLIHGVGLSGLKDPDKDIYLGNSGTSARLLMGLIMGQGISATILGDRSLSSRPMARVMKPLSMMGGKFMAKDNSVMPIHILKAKELKAIEYEMKVASAQVKSAIILAGLNLNSTTKIIETKPTRDHTELMLKAAGADISTIQQDDGSYLITLNGGNKLSGQNITVPSDPSSAAFLTVAALITKGSEIRMDNICINKRRIGLFDTLIEMGGDISFINKRITCGEETADIIVKSSKLKGITVPTSRTASMIDEYPILSMAAACADGVTYMEDIGELRVKESDRLRSVEEGLNSLHVKTESTLDSLTIFGNGKPPIGNENAIIKTNLDHRIAMSFLILGNVTDYPVTIDDSTPIDTSFPDFKTICNQAGMDIS